MYSDTPSKVRYRTEYGVKRMKKNVIVDSRIDKKCESSLAKMGYKVIKAAPSPYLATPVASHPDMLFFVAKGRLVCEKRYRNDNADTLEMIASVGGLQLLEADELLSAQYPADVLFNAAPIGERLVCRKSSVSSAVLGLYAENDIINVRQGYAKCSSLTVGDGAIVTADPSVAKEAERAGISVLRIGSGGVRLDGYDCGFIGGACGDDGEHILFCGDISLHPDGEIIADFCRRRGREPISLSDGELYDYGTLIFF